MSPLQDTSEHDGPQHLWHMVIRPGRCRHLGNLCQRRDQLAPNALMLIDRADVQGREARISSSSPSVSCLFTLPLRALAHPFHLRLQRSRPERAITGNASRPIAAIEGRVPPTVQCRILLNRQQVCRASRAACCITRNTGQTNPISINGFGK